MKLAIGLTRLAVLPVTSFRRLRLAEPSKKAGREFSALSTFLKVLGI
jgi:hypothetical protein